MKGTPLKTLLLGLAVLCATLGGGAPRILCVGPGGHTAVEDALCGAFGTGAFCCEPHGSGPDFAPFPRGASCFSGEQADGCTDTVLQSRALTAGARTLPAPGPVASLHAAARTLSSPQSEHAAKPTSSRQPEPSVPLDRHTALLI